MGHLRGGSDDFAGLAAAGDGAADGGGEEAGPGAGA